MVKCVDCGFLALRNSRARELDEAEDLYRRTGDVTLDGDYLRHERLPICFARTWNLRDEFHKHIAEEYDVVDRERWLRSPQPEHTLAIINKERRCSGFVEWQQGFTPKEHREILDRQEQRDWQERQRRDERKWRIAELVLLIIGAGVFTIVGAVISKGGWP